MAKKETPEDRRVNHSKETKRSVNPQATHLVLIKKLFKGKPSKVPIESVTKIVQDYKEQVLAEVTTSQQHNLQQAGYKVIDLRPRTKIRIGEFHIDPTIREEREKAVGTADEEETIKTEYYFIQFKGPVKPEWLEATKEIGLTPLSYYHDFAFLVHGKKEDIEKIAGKPYIRATMPYGSGLKLDESSLRLEMEGKGKQEFWILLFATGSNVDLILRELTTFGITCHKEMERGAFYLKVRATIPTDILNKVKKIPEIYRIEKVYPIVNADEVADQVVAGNYNATGQVVAPPTGVHPYLDWLEEMDIDGTGVTCGIVEYDGRIDENHQAFTGRISQAGTVNAKNYHATMVGGQAAADYRGEVDPNGFYYGLGIAPGSHLLNQSQSNPTTNCRDTLTNTAPNGQPGTVQNNSWGWVNTNGDYRSNERTYDSLVRDANSTIAGNQPLIICFAAGNEGNSGLLSPNRAKNIITTGNFENYRPANLYGCGENDADNINERYIKSCNDSSTGASSIGNCGDGRTKPDVVAPGQWTASANYNVTATSPRYISGNCVYGGGTSAASPKIAGACALLIQWWRQRHTIDSTQLTPSAALVKAMLINGAVDTGEGGSIPNEEQGWGRINLNNVLDPEIPTIYADQDILLQPGSNDIEFDIEPNDTNKPMKITLVWTDVPGPDPSGTAGNPALVNALGLEVSKGTNIWFGNNFTGGFSQTGGVQDAIQNACPNQIVNNVQNVFIENPSGTYHVRISPENIAGNCLSPNNPTNLPFQQDFAIVIQNAELKNTEPMDVMLCIDRTGSMQGAPIAAAKAAAMQFMDLIPTGDKHKAGLVSYATPCSYPYAPPCDNNVSINDRSTVDVDLAQVTQPMKDNMTDLAGPIATINAANCTSIGAGLRKAAERIIDNGSPLHRKVIVLLTDGMENRSPCVSRILPLLRKEYKVHVIAYGNSINQAMVDDISSSTHAELLHAPTEEQLAEFYHQLLALETTDEIANSESDIIAAEETATHEKRFPVVNSDRKARFIVGWISPEAKLNVELVTPKGNVIDPTNVSAIGNAKLVQRNTHVIYSLNKPSGSNIDWEGEWSVRITRQNDSASKAEKYTASLLVQSSLRLSLQWDKLQYYTGDLVKLKAQIVDKQFVLTNGINMSIQAKVPIKGYASLLSELPKRTTSIDNQDTVTGILSGLDTLAKTEEKEIYKDLEEVMTTIEFEAAAEDTAEKSVIARSWTPHIAILTKHFRPKKDGIYTYRIKAEGNTESGARFSRIRTVSKYIEAKLDVGKSTVTLKPSRNIHSLNFTPRDAYGNLVGPGHSNAIKIDVKKGKVLDRLIRDNLDGTYSVDIEAYEHAEQMAITITMNNVSIPLSASTLQFA